MQGAVAHVRRESSLRTVPSQQLPRRRTTACRNANMALHAPSSLCWGMRSALCCKSGSAPAATRAAVRYRHAALCAHTMAAFIEIVL
jgi:hypothetical protein